MTEIVYTIIHMPTGKHHLKEGELTRGFFDTHELAVAGMKRLIKPEITNFDKDGNPT